MLYSTEIKPKKNTKKTAMFAALSLVFGVVMMATFAGTATVVFNTQTAYASSVPTITLVGNTNISINIGGTYTESGYVANDAEDGDLTGSVTVNDGGLNTNVAGVYTLTYSVTDSDSNTSTATRTVTIVDPNTAPVITLLGSTTINLNAGDTYTEPGYTASDTQDGDLTGSVTVNDGGLDTNTAGTYTLTYSVTDSGSLTDSKTRTVIIAAPAGNTAPVITLLGSTTITLTVGGTYTEPGYTATDTEEGDLTGSVSVNDGGLDTNTVGTYTLTYSVSDTPGLTDTKTRTVNIIAAGGGNTPPVITLVGGTVNLTVGDTYTEPGYTATDVQDGSLTGAVTVNDGGLDTNTVGTYTFTYSVTDSGGLSDTETRTVIVTAAPCTACGGTPTPTPPGGGGTSNTAPVIYLLRVNEIEMFAGDDFVDAPIKGEDNEDGDVTAKVVVDLSNLDPNTVGEYEIKYNVTDSGGLKAPTRKRTVKVLVNPNPKPELPEEPKECTYLIGFSRLDNTIPGENDPVEVRKVQKFLNEFEGANLEVDGIFNEDTDAWVRAFQEKYRGDILDPWAHEETTGYVYLTTRKKINEIYCEREFPLTLSEENEIDDFRNRPVESPASVTPTTSPGTDSDTTEEPALRDLIGDVDANDGTRAEDPRVGSENNEDSSGDLANTDLEDEDLAATGATDRNVIEDIAVGVYKAIRNIVE